MAPGDPGYPVLLVAPIGQDAPAIAVLLASHSIDARICEGLADCGRRIEPKTAALLMTEEALDLPQLSMLIEALNAQPAWSELPLIVLSQSIAERRAALTELMGATTAKITVLERPMHAGTLLNTVHVALRARQRQYQVRDLLEAQERSLLELKRSEDERAHLLEAERTARTELERMSRLKDEFLATISHELRSPLNGILGWAQLFKRTRPDEQTFADGVDAILNNGLMQSQIISDLLDMNQIMNGKLRMKTQDVDLVRVIQDALATVRPGADAKRVRIETSLDARAGPVTGDPARLQQVVWNLLGNAVKFTPEGGRVSVTLEQIGPQAVVTVSDTGVGIRPDFLPHVFERFRQSDSSSTRRHGGLGLGLSIARQMVELHGGTISVRSGGEGRGATFCVRLPIVLERTGAMPQSLLEAESTDRLIGARILVVDDDPGACEVLQRLLTPCRAEVECVNSGHDALERIEARNPDLLLCDIGMPEMDGFGVIRHVRAAGATFPAIAITAFARAEDRLRATQTGFNMHLSKPVDVSELIAAMTTLLKAREP